MEYMINTIDTEESLSHSTEREVALTTIDNPYDPIDDYDNWRAYDYQHGYCTDEYIARILYTSSEFTDEMQEEDYERAIDAILEYDFMHMYRKIVKEGKGG